MVILVMEGVEPVSHFHMQINDWIIGGVKIYISICPLDMYSKVILKRQK